MRASTGGEGGGHFCSKRPFRFGIINHQPCPLSITRGKSCSWSSGFLCVQPCHVHSTTAAGSPGKISTRIRCHITDTAGRVLLRQYFSLVPLGAPLGLRAGISFWGRRGVEGGRWFHEVCQLVSNTSSVIGCMCARVRTSSDYAERNRGSLLRVVSQRMPINS